MNIYELKVLQEITAAGKKPPALWRPDKQGVEMLREWFFDHWSKLFNNRSVTVALLKSYFLEYEKIPDAGKRFHAIVRFYNVEDTEKCSDRKKFTDFINGLQAKDKLRAVSNFLNKKTNFPNADMIILLLDVVGKLYDVPEKNIMNDKSTLDVHPFLNRTEELNKLRLYMNDPGVRLVMVHGQSGYGKTAFVNNFIKTSVPEGIVCHITRFNFREKEQKDLITLPEMKEDAFVHEHAGKTRVQYHDLQTMNDWLALLSGAKLQPGQKHLIVMDGLDGTLSSKHELKNRIMEDFIEFVIRVRETDAVILMTSNTLPVFRNSITAWHSNRFRRIEIDSLDDKSVEALFLILDNDPGLDCGFGALTGEERSKYAGFFGGRPETVIEFIAYLKNNRKKVREISPEKINQFALKHQHVMFVKLSDIRKEILKFLSGAGDIVPETKIYNAFAGTQTEQNLDALVRTHLLRYVKETRKKGYQLHPMTQRYLDQHMRLEKTDEKMKS